MLVVLVQIQKWVRHHFIIDSLHVNMSLFFQEHLCEYFAKFGNVESATVKFDKSGRSKGFGFVLFEDRDSTDKVITYISEPFFFVFLKL